MRWIALVTALALAAPAFAQNAPDSSGASVNRLTVTGSGAVAGTPDMAIVTLGAAATASSAADAMDRTSVATAAILERLADAGIAGRDIQTSDLSLTPLHGNRASGPGNPEITGFEASNTVTVRIRELDRLSNVLETALESGANRFHNLRFTLQDPEPALDEARRRAVADAMRKAALLAEAAGVTLGAVLDLTESNTGGGGPVMYRTMAEAVPVAAGEVTSEASVTMVFAISGP